MKHTRKNIKKGGTDARMRIFVKNVLNAATSYLLGGRNDDDNAERSPYYQLLIYSNCHEPILNNLTNFILKKKTINRLLKEEYNSLEDKGRWRGHHTYKIIKHILETSGLWGKTESQHQTNQDIITYITNRYFEDIQELFSLDSLSNTAKHGLIHPLSEHSVDPGTIMDISEVLDLRSHIIKYNDPKNEYPAFN